MWPHSIKKIEQTPETTSDDLAAPAILETSEQPTPALPETSEQASAAQEDEPPSAPEQEWNSATEEEWTEHRETAWALAYVIHRIRSTPNPPILLPAQKQHFQKTIERAAALIEEWQRRERDLAQQLVQAKPVTELSSETAEAIQNDLPEDIPDEIWDKQLATPSSYLILDDAEEDAQPTQEAPQAPETPAPLYDYEI
jgi:hypothetical protein